MKKAIIVAAILALPTFAGQKLVAVLPPAQPAAPAPAVSPWSLEMAASYSWAEPDINRYNSPCKEMKSIGADITGVYSITGTHAVTLRFGYTWGGEKFAEDYGIWAPGHYWNKTRIHTFTLMPGYRYTQAITDRVSWFAGANFGIANASVKENWYEDSERYASYHKSAWGFAYSAEVGLRYALTPCMDVFCAYQYYGNTASPKDDESIRYTHRQHGHQARVGVGFKF